MARLMVRRDLGLLHLLLWLASDVLVGRIP
jgi:hypothetical protein